MSRKSAETISAAKKWFALANYQPIATFGPYRWLDQIKKRTDIEAAFGRNDKAYLDQAIPSLMVNPLGPILIASEYLLPRDKQPLPPVVRDLDLPDIDRIQRLEERHSDALPSRPTATIKQLQLRPAALGLAPHPLEAYLVVRLDAKDSEIIEGLKAWLKERRAFTPEAVIDEWATAFESEAASLECEASAVVNTDFHSAAKSILDLAEVHRRSSSGLRKSTLAPDVTQGIQARFDDWYYRKIIPYFDITAWERWSKNRLSDPDKADLLFKRGDSKPNVDLKPTKKLALEVINLDLAMSLAMHAFARDLANQQQE